MVKYLMITNFVPDRKTKYGEKVIVEGLLYKNRYKASKGREFKQLWLNNKYAPIITVGKDLYVEFGEHGIQSIEVK